MTELSRRHLSDLAAERRIDAQTLLASGRWGAAYHFFGLAIELAVKACAARTVAAETVPEKSFSSQFYTHNIAGLLALAGLKDALTLQQANPQFAARWQIVVGWSIESRYDVVDEGDARAIADAVDNPQGVFAWLATFW